jgi:hypothetical protein
VRLLLALAAQEGWPVHHMDVRSAFLNDDLLEEVIYVRQPPGCVVDGKEDMVLRLDKALYELRLAPRCLRPRTRELPAARRRLRRRPTIAKFKKQMCAKFQMSDLGLLFFFIWALRCSKGATASNSSRRHTQARSWSVRAWRAVIRASLPWSTA